MQASEGQYPDTVADMMTDLLFLASPNQAHWRYSQRAGLLLLFMLPTPNADSARKLTQHFLSLVLSQLPSQRSLGLTGLLVLLRGGQRHQPAVRTEVQQALEGQAQFGPALLEQMSHAHPSGGQDGPAERYRLSHCLLAVSLTHLNCSDIIFLEENVAESSALKKQPVSR